MNKTELVAITNVASGVNSNTAFGLVSNDNWKSATISGQFETGDVYATTGTVKNGKLYVNYGGLNKLGSTLKSGKPLRDSFKIVEIAAQSK